MNIAYNIGKEHSKNGIVNSDVIKDCSKSELYFYKAGFESQKIDRSKEDESRFMQLGEWYKK